MNAGHALYYPHIHLYNKNWLKYALLYWDKISRIVPASVQPSDSEEIIRINAETGFIEDYSPSGSVVRDTFKSFSPILDRILKSEHHYLRYKQAVSDDWAILWRKQIRSIGSRLIPYAKPEGTYLHIEKLDSELKDKLINLGLAIPGANPWEDWIRLDNELGYLYMIYLSNTISKKERLPVVTDEENYYSTSIYFEPEIFSDYEGEFEYKVGNLLIECYLPKNINEVPLDKIIKIREKYEDERLNFRLFISDLAKRIQPINNKRDMESALNSYSRLLTRETDNMIKIFNSFKIESVRKFLYISVPSLISSGYIPEDYKPIAIVGGISFGIISAVASVRKERLQLQDNPRSYLINIKSELSGENVFRRINDTITGFRKW